MILEKIATVSHVNPSSITLAFQMPRAEDAELTASSGHIWPEG
jgi:hypothetical protein